MNPRYVPILRTKQGEFEAFNNLRREVKREVLPLFELSKFTDELRTRVRFRGANNPTELYVRELAVKINDALDLGRLMIDISKWSPNSTLESGVHLLDFVSSCLTDLGCDVIPVIGYDRWEDREYSSILRSLSSRYSSFCLRLESYAFDDMVEDEHFLGNIDNIIDSLGLDVAQCCVVLDFGANQLPIVELEEKISEALALLSPYGFQFISIAGCSVSVMINDMVGEQDSTGLVVRRELIAWKSIRTFNTKSKLVFGDYGIMNPNTKDDVKAIHANCKIRYTIQEQHFIVRGHSRMQGWNQMYGLSQSLMSSQYYLGENFSWGDAQIERCSREVFTGNATKWVAYDMNHHITYVVAEVLELERNLAAEQGRIENA